MIPLIPSRAFRRFCRLIFVAIALGWFPPPTRAGVIYSILDLGTLGGASSSAVGINASGQVVGTSDNYIDSVTYRAFRTSSNGVISATSDLGHFADQAFSSASGINSSGQVVGSGYSDGMTRPFRTSANGVIDAASELGSLGGIGRGSANAINSSGQTVGDSRLSTGSYHAYRTSATGKIDAASDLGFLGGQVDWSTAYGINDSGQVVGVSYTPVYGIQHAFRTTANGKITLGSDLGSLAGTNGNSYGYDINSSGVTVGTSATSQNSSSPSHAFRTTANGSITTASDLGTLGGSTSVASSVNAFGQTVGYSTIRDNTTQHAFFAAANGPMQDLNDLVSTASGWVLNYAGGINASGQIAGAGTIGGQQHAFVLNPVPSAPPVTHVISIGVDGDRISGSINSARVATAFSKLPGVADVSNFQFTLSDGDSNRQSLIALINQEKTKVKSGDNFVFYINSHGFYDRLGSGNESPANASYDLSDLNKRRVTTAPRYFVLSTNELTATNNLTDEAFAELFRDPAWTSVNKLFILDNCFAGGFWGHPDAPNGGNLISVPNSALIAASSEADASSATSEADGHITGNLGKAVVSALDSLKGAPFSYSTLFSRSYVDGARYRGINGVFQDGVALDLGVDMTSVFDPISIATWDSPTGEILGVPEPAMLGTVVPIIILLLSRRKH